MKWEILNIKIQYTQTLEREVEAALILALFGFHNFEESLDLAIKIVNKIYNNNNNPTLYDSISDAKAMDLSETQEHPITNRGAPVKIIMVNLL